MPTDFFIIAPTFYLTDVSTSLVNTQIEIKVFIKSKQVLYFTQ